MYKNIGNHSFTTRQPMVDPHFSPLSSFPLVYSIASPMETRQESTHVAMNY
jgi:hypothetical protein